MLIAAVLTRAQSGGPIPASFFAMSAVQGDYPRVNIGALAHQQFAWETIERSRGVFDFSVFDSYMTGAVSHGLIDSATNTANFAMTLAAGTPSWAVADQSSCGGTRVCTAPPDNIQDWKDFLGAVIQHYNGKTQPHIRYYELWNEFNISLWWTGTDAQLLALAQAAFPIIHQDSYSILLTPSVAGPAGTALPNSGATLMTRYLQAGGSKYADGGAFHGYPAAQTVTPFPMPEQSAPAGCKGAACYGSVIAKVSEMRAVFDQNGLAGKPMFQTEGSWGNQTIIDLDTQIAWLARWNLLHAGLRASMNLQMNAWFTWGGGTTFGWGDIEGASLEPTVAGVAYNQIFNWVVGAAMDKPCSGAADGTWTCALTRPGGYTAQAVWNTQGSIAYTPGAAFTQFRDLTGKITSIVPGTPVTIGAKPILLEGVAGTQPVVTVVANAEGDAAIIAPNTWVEIKGFNLAPPGDSRVWQDADFVKGQMPSSLDGVGATVKGESAFVYFVSPNQVNILTPPDAINGTVEIQVVNGAQTGASFSAIGALASPSFFVFNGGPYVAAAHLDGTLIGPASLFPALTTPAKAGETIVLFANGFGATSAAIVRGSPTQSGTLSPKPVVRIGGVAATVQFAGLVAPGEFQFNVMVPANLTDGDAPITATYQGLSTQPGAVLTIKN
jgi:uncharacterized protein (TIGR03437 family)